MANTAARGPRALPLWCLLAVVVACGSTSPSSPPPGGSTSTIGPAGGQVSASGVELDVPPGALATPTSIAVTVDPSGAPAPYVALSPLFHFSPDGLTFARPATVTFAIAGNPHGAHVYWSQPAGTAYDELPTTWVGMTAAATVSHFSRGFVGTLTGDASDVEDATNPTDAGEAPDQGAPDATMPQDATASQDASPFEGGAPAEGGLVESDSSVDAGTTLVSGLVQGATPTAGNAVAITVDEWSSASDADGGCTGQVKTGQQQTTIPASALPYVFRLSFSDPSTTACTGRTYDVSVTDDDSGGNVVASGTNSCAGTFGAPVSCGVSLVLAPTDAGPPMADASPDASVDAGDLLTSTIQFSGTVTGTMPPGASYLYIALMASTDPASTMNNMPFCSPTVPNPQMASSTVVAPTLPVTYSFSYGPNFNICGASFEIDAYPMNGSFSQLPGSAISRTPCGGIGNTGGGTQIQSTSVTCDVVLP
jgi:hypothetical protein